MSELDSRTYKICSYLPSVHAGAIVRDVVHSSFIFCGYGLYGGEYFLTISDRILKSHSNSLTTYAGQHAAVLAAFTAKVLSNCCEVSADILENTLLESMSKDNPPVTIQVMKQAIRQRIIAGREQLTVAERACLSHAISERIANLNVYRTANTVLAYMSFGAEFSTEEWVQQALRDGKCVLLPKVNRATKELDIYRVTNLQNDLVLGQWNIREPLVERCVKINSLQELDFILLPGIAFGCDGARLGYGGGFYDKLLARIKDANQSLCPALVAGAFSIQLVEGLPQEATDHKVEWVVTENETIQCVSDLHPGK